MEPDENSYVITVGLLGIRKRHALELAEIIRYHANSYGAAVDIVTSHVKDVTHDC